MRRIVDAYLSTLSTETRRTYQHLLGRLVEWCEREQVALESLDETLFQIFLDDQPGWGVNSQRLAGCAARAFCRWRFGDRHPVLQFKLRRVKPAPQRHLSRGQATRLLEAINTSTLLGIRNLAILTLALDTGLRAHELAELELKHVQLDDRRLNAKVKGGEWKPRVFTRYTASCLAAWVQASAAQRRTTRMFYSLQSLCRKKGEMSEDHIGGALTTAGIKSVFRHISEQTGVKFSAHDLRRTMAILASLHGGARKLVADNAGWSDTAMLDYYTRGIELDPDEWERCSPVNWLMGLGDR